MAGEVVNRQVVVNIVADDVMKAQETLLARQKKLNQEIAKTNDPKALADLNKQLKATEQQIDRNSKVLKGDLLPTYNQLTSAVKKYYSEWKKTGDPEVLKRYQEANALLKMQKDQLNKVEGAAKGLSNVSIFKSAFWANLAAGAVTGFFSSFSGFLSSSIDEALQADLSTKRLESTLNNLGRSDAFDRLTAKADQMAQKFRYLDNDDIVGVFEKLIDYGKLTEKEINNLLPVIIDFAAKSRIDLATASDVVVKALEGNGKAMKQYGIDLKDANTETERLNIVMTTLKEKVDGAAEAFQNSAAGGVATARQEFANLKEDIGNQLIPALNSLMQFVIGAIKGIKQFATDIKSFFVGSNPTGDYDGRLAAAAQANKKFLDEVRSIKGITDNAVKNAIINESAIWEDEIKKNTEALTPIVDKFNQLKSQLERGDSEATKANLSRLAGFKNEIDELNGRNRYLSERVRLLKEEAAVIGNNTKIGVTQPNAPAKTPKAKEPEKQVKELENVWQRIAKIQEAAYKAVQGVARDQRQVFADADKFIKANVNEISKLNIDNQGIDAAGRIGRFDRNRVAGLELQVQTTRSKQRLAAELALLTELERQELDNKELTENEKLLIEEQYRQRRKEAEVNFWNSIVANVGDYANSILNVLNTFDSIRSSKENAELERDRRTNDKKEQNLQNRLRKGLISQAEYDRQIDQLKQKQDKKEQQIQLAQFKRNQKIAIAQAFVNAAQGVTSTLAARPGLTDILGLGVARALQIGLIATTLAAQIASINGQKPQFARGGKLGGRLHSEGGNPIMDGNGNKIAEIERGEGIINRRSMTDNRTYTLSGTPSQIASTINGMHGGIRWENPARFINYGALNKRYYAAGGTFGTDGSSTGIMDTAMLMDILSRLDSTLKRGVKAYTVLTDQEDAQTRLDNIRAEATMK